MTVTVAQVQQCVKELVEGRCEEGGINGDDERDRCCGNGSFAEALKGHCKLIRLPYQKPPARPAISQE